MNENDAKIKKALQDNMFYDYIANEYGNMSKWELKEVLLAVLGICYDKCCGEEDEQAFMKLVEEELHNRFFFDEDQKGGQLKCLRENQNG